MNLTGCRVDTSRIHFKSCQRKMSFTKLISKMQIAHEQNVIASRKAYKYCREYLLLVHDSDVLLT